MRKNIILLLLIFLYNNSYSQWIALQSPATSDFSDVNFINASTGYVAGDTGLFFKTINGGANWSSLNSGITANINSIYFFNSTTGIACGDSGYIIISTNSGVVWNPVASGVSHYLNSISFQNNFGVCGGGETLLYSTNSGFNWTIANAGNHVAIYHGTFVLSQTTSFACGSHAILFPSFIKTTNGGISWSNGGINIGGDGNLTDMYFISADKGFALVSSGQGALSYTSNGGTSWSTEFFGTDLKGLDFAGTNIGYAVGRDGYIIKTTNQGTNWINQTSGVSNILRDVDFLDSLNGFIVGDGGIILKTTNGGLTSTNNNIITVPNNFSLEQNYPNPFNPTTVIRYSLASRSGLSAEGGEKGFANLKIFSSLGKEVAKLVNQKQNAGSYEVKFNGSDLASGIYIYRLEVNGEVIDSKRMILLR